MPSEPASDLAFPMGFDYEHQRKSQPGLTKREWYAGMALGRASIQSVSPTEAERTARMCLLYADALLAELAKDGEEG